MDREQYIKVMDFVRSKKHGISIIYITGKIITFLTALVYIITAALLVYMKDIRVIRVIAVPAAGFILLSAARASTTQKDLMKNMALSRFFLKIHMGKAFQADMYFRYLYVQGQ